MAGMGGYSGVSDSGGGKTKPRRGGNYYRHNKRKTPRGGKRR